jgi:hypothetical protein
METSWFKKNYNAPKLNDEYDAKSLEDIDAVFNEAKVIVKCF